MYNLKPLAEPMLLGPSINAARETQITRRDAITVVDDKYTGNSKYM